ncbi:MAG TPA: hypothetical protein DHU96_12050 [Actinobacteria bacterium]|nr:hypothetical protein [Actinomycetota bacterium]
MDATQSAAPDRRPPARPPARGGGPAGRSGGAAGRVAWPPGDAGRGLGAIQRARLRRGVLAAAAAGPVVRAAVRGRRACRLGRTTRWCVDPAGDRRARRRGPLLRRAGRDPGLSWGGLRRP